MALRVLLADESSTIKKVFQLSLQDFAVEVQAVDIGTDVVPVAKKFKPDIIFIDILLQKKNGYLVSSEIKADPQLKHLPVVLMWSGFLELDQDKFQVSQATDALEKPFDTAALRELIKTHVPKTGTQSLSQYLKFPKAPKVEPKQPTPDQLIELGGGPPVAPKNFKKKPIPEELSAAEVVDLDTHVNTSTWNMDKFSNIDLKATENTGESFHEMSIPKSAKMARQKEESKPDILADEPEQGGTGWVQQNIDRFRMNHINPEEVEGEIPIEFETPPSPQTSSQIRTFEPAGSDIELEIDDVVAAAGPAPQKAAFNASIDEEKWEKILREEASKAIEAVVWKVIPELAERIIERELKRLLDEKKSNILTEVPLELTKLIAEAYLEDIPKGDVTTDGLLDKSRPGFAKLIAKEDLILSGVDIFSACFRYQTIDADLKWQFKDGDAVVAGQTVALIHGPLASLLKAERVALNFLGHLSGIATYTKCFVRETAGTKTKILDTRKTTPLFRDLEKRAVVHGGGVNHRMNLSTAVLVKDNHKMMVGGLRKAVETLKAKTDLPIVVEVENLDEVKEAVSLNVCRILLDNMSDEMLKQALTLIPSYIETEVSGGITVDRVNRLAKMGVMYISVGAITHSAPCADFSLLFERGSNV